MATPHTRTPGEVTVGLWLPETEAERQAIREQLERILASPLFTNSKRYPSFLRYVVEHSLAGNTEHLKERTIGIEVFGRTPEYDTNQDPVVRTSAAQVRHRIAQYYYEHGAESEIRIELLPGSYIPQFRLMSHEEDTGKAIGTLALLDDLEVAPAHVEPPVSDPKPSRSPAPRKRNWSWAAAGLIPLAAIAWAATTFWPASPVDKFWGTVWEDGKPIIICAPGRFPTDRASTPPVQPLAGASASGNIVTPTNEQPPMSIGDSLRQNGISFADATTLYMLTGFLGSHGQSFKVRRDGHTTLPDLKEGSAIFIGGFNHEWLMRLNKGLRFNYQRDPENRRILRIVDAKDQSIKHQVDLDKPFSSFTIDYGIVSRFRDPTTERIVVIASGIAAYGTIAAGDFLTNEAHLTELAKIAPAGWEKKNLQVLFTTTVVTGNSGPPKIIAVHVW